MKIPVSEARRRLPALLREMQRDPTARYQITVRDEPVAELRPLEAGPAPGEAAERLITLRRRLVRVRRGSGPSDVSSRVKDYLYGRRRAPE